MRVRLFIFLLAGMLWLPASVVGQQLTPTPSAGATIHVVQRGETLFRIALQYGLTVDQVARANSISDPSNIFAGQRLLIPSTGTATPVPSVMHIVQPGETLESIAQLYGMTADDLAARNHLTDANEFHVGLLLDISESVASSEAPAVTDVAATDLPTTPTSLIVHTVLRGETVGKIARQYGVTVNSIVQANHIVDPQLIYTGQDLVIPEISAPKLALDLPASVQSLDVEPLLFVEGETGVIHLTTASATQISGTFINQTLNDGSENGDTQHTLLVGIPVGTAASVYPLDLVLTDSSGSQTPISMNIQVISGGYGRQSIQLIAGLEDLTNPQLQTAELTHLQSITSNFTTTRYFDGLLGLPSAAPLSARFGDQRSYNGGAFASIHTGTDFAAAPGSPIKAPAAGKVVFVGPLDIRGNVTIIDHGWGIFTVYCHQTEQFVSVGDMVTAGQVIGSTGSTGRVTGPHLHWELWVDGVPVDAMQWVTESFS